MDNLPQIKWHGEKLYELLVEQYQDHPILGDLAVRLEAQIINNTTFKNIKAMPPTTTVDTTATIGE